MKLQKLPQHIRQMIDRLKEDELHALYSAVSERLRLFHRTKALFAMRNFQILDKVFFDYHGEKKEGTVTRLNQRTVSVTLNNGEHWNVSPALLKKIDEESSPKELPTTSKVSRNIN